MQIVLNGDPHEVPEPLSVASLLTHLAIDARRVAVEVNETVIKRARYDDTPIAPRDRVEIVNFVGGG